MPCYAAQIVPNTYERRSEVRKNVKLDARWLMKNEPDAVACVVTNISEFGARVRLPGPAYFVPQKTKLYIEEIQVLAECVQVWRKGQDIGVKFTTMTYLD